ncbi:MAG: hypothetical protein ACYTFA_19520 [Planctomycetota bacterium]
MLLEIDRAEEFSPVKNATGVDSLDTAKRDQVRRACRWLEAAGAAIPRDPEGEPDLILEIAPAYALDAEDVRERADQLPCLTPGQAIYLELGSGLHAPIALRPLTVASLVGRN